jgi:hypothetical protein
VAALIYIFIYLFIFFYIHKGQNHFIKHNYTLLNVQALRTIFPSPGEVTTWAGVSGGGGGGTRRCRSSLLGLGTLSPKHHRSI